MLNILNQEKHAPDSRSQASVELSSVYPFGGGGWALWHHEGHVARKRATRRYHLDFTGGGARGDGGRD